MPTKLDDLRQLGVAQPDARLADLELLLAADAHSVNGIRTALQKGANIDARHPDMGISALHIAIGNNDLALCRFLIEECSARFFPDKFGRWPTLIAAECHADETLSDYIVEQEALFLRQNPS
ncbi:ankyrin repeat domain-containing protein [Sabulicella glaciei]|uniref:Ankyrin repeat domain-containing protein n=1 Tax=Sabulicella glaciei TaxID=2984948 RepID=A0ABT3NZY2_9PROT|nr:ankyrin repeat domain-containing protein [Roseococcus sp. MDT2-1-1]MCW8087722.1 ankyrin repeat domain-containing protein [Roseococcus sp. MDT2-1-1]